MRQRCDDPSSPIATAGRRTLSAMARDPWRLWRWPTITLPRSPCLPRGWGKDVGLRTVEQGCGAEDGDQGATLLYLRFPSPKLSALVAWHPANTKDHRYMHFLMLAILDKMFISTPAWMFRHFFCKFKCAHRSRNSVWYAYPRPCPCNRVFACT